MNAIKKIKGNEILAAYAGENWGYQNSKIMYLAGKQNAGQDTVGTIVSPVQAQGVVIDSAVPDTLVFSFTWQGKLRQILVKIQSKGGQPSTCTLRLLAPKAKGAWKSLSGDVSLIGSNGLPLLQNPHGMTQWGNVLYFADYETKNIVMLGANELKGMEGNYTPVNTPFPLGDEAGLPPNAKGQAIIAMNHRLFALYLDTDTSAEGHANGILTRMVITSGGVPSYETKTLVGRNPQAIIPVNDGTKTQLLIPAIGGVQAYDGSTNGVQSDIRVVDALGTWSASTLAKITGDDYTPPTPPAPPAPTAYDIHGIAAAMRGPGSMMYIMSQIYEDGSDKAEWRIYQGTVGAFLNYAGGTLTEAVDAGVLTVVDKGSIENVTYEGLYFWDLLYEQYPGVGDTGDRLWIAFGTAILVTRAAAGTYGSPTSTADSAVLQPYALYGYNGGVNINCIDLTIDVVNQTKREVFLKHGMRASRAPRAGNAVDK